MTTMTPTLNQVQGLVEAELSRHDIPDARARLSPFLIVPTPMRLPWQYGDEETFDAWLVGRSHDGEIGLVYCTEGLGSGGTPWGGVILAEGHQGMDCNWYSGLADAAICFRLIDPPEGYMVPGPRD